MIHAAIFDMDGLLFDTESLCCTAWREIAGNTGYRIRESLFLECVGLNSRDTRERVMNEMGPEFPYEDFGIKARQWMRSRMEADGPPLKPGAGTLLEYLVSRKIPVALATSTSESSARWMIERAGFARYFDAYAFGSEVENGKPAPDIFLLAMERLGIDTPDGCVVFEDSAAGLRAAQAAGMLTVFVPDMVEPPREVEKQIWKRITRLDEAASDDFFKKSNKYA